MSIKNIAINFALLVLFTGGIALGYYLAQPSTIFFTRDHAETKDSLFIKQSLHTYIQVTPSMFVATPHIGGSPKLLATETLTKEEQSSIMQTMNAIAEKVQASNICDGGSYSLNPKKYWVKDVAKSGYEALQSMRCKFKEDDKKSYEALLNDITQIVQANTFLTLSIPQITPIVDIVDYNKELYEARLGMLKDVHRKFLQDYQDTLGAKCSLADVNFVENQMPRPYYAKANMVMQAPSADSVVLPTIGTEEHKVEIEFSVHCNNFEKRDTIQLSK